MVKKTKVGIIGCGTIGREIGKAIINDFDTLELHSVSEKEKNNLDKFNKTLNTQYTSISIHELISNVDIIIESASAKVSYEITYKALESGKKIIVMSVGGLLEGLDDLIKLSQVKGGRLYIPSGAICGLDGLKAASCGKIYKVVLITHKSSRSFEGVEYLIEKKINVIDIKNETCVFDGTAQEAVKAFPKNINVALTLSLAGIGAQKTKVKIFADPACKKNIHEIYVEGDFGRFYIRIENEPSPDNPKTSYLAILSAISILKNITSSINIGG